MWILLCSVSSRESLCRVLSDLLVFTVLRSVASRETCWLSECTLVLLIMNLMPPVVLYESADEKESESRTCGVLG